MSVIRNTRGRKQTCWHCLHLQFSKNNYLVQAESFPGEYMSACTGFPLPQLYTIIALAHVSSFSAAFACPGVTEQFPQNFVWSPECYMRLSRWFGSLVVGIGLGFQEVQFSI